MHSLRPQQRRRLNRHPRDLKKRLRRDGRGLAAGHGGDEGRGAGILPLVLTPQIHAPEAGLDEGAKFTEVVQLQHPAGAEDLDVLLGETGGTIGQLMGASSGSSWRG